MKRIYELDIPYDYRGDISITCDGYVGKEIFVIKDITTEINALRDRVAPRIKFIPGIGVEEKHEIIEEK